MYYLKGEFFLISSCKNMSVVQNVHVCLQQDGNIKIMQDTQRQLLEKLKELQMEDWIVVNVSISTYSFVFLFTRVSESSGS